MRPAVIGAGVTGIVAAYRLSQRGYACDVYERWPGLGGQAATLDVGGGHLLERYYHHLFTSDRHIVELYEELGMPDEIEWRPSSVAMFVDGDSHAFTSPADLLRFSPMSSAARVRMGAAVVWPQRRYPTVDPFHDVTTREWVNRAMGRQAWDKVWGPLLHEKFGRHADQIAMAWLWSTADGSPSDHGKQARNELLGYPRHSWELLYDRLRDEIERAGGRVMIDRPAARLARGDGSLVVVPGAAGSFRSGHDPREFAVVEEGEAYDGVIATVSQ